jgi:Ca2+-binding RTX toxin-like protein
MNSLSNTKATNLVSAIVTATVLLSSTLWLATTAITPQAAMATALTPTCLGKPATIVGTSGNDNLVGTSGPDVIAGLGGNDNIVGLGGDDLICGGEGNDRIDAGAGNDQVDGGAGTDTAVGGFGTDRCDAETEVFCEA